jgi:hypothetical protein
LGLFGVQVRVLLRLPLLLLVILFFVNTRGLSFLDGSVVNAATLAKKPQVETFKTDKLGSGEIFDATLIEENPDYVNDDQSDDHSDDQSDDDDNDDEFDAEFQETIKVMGDKTAQATERISNAMRERKHHHSVWIKKWKQHRASITLVVAAFAFRNELWALVGFVLGQFVKNFTITDILKLILFMNFIRRIQTGDFLSTENESLAGSLGRSRSWLALVLQLLPSNPAYISPIAQHYTFQR